MKKFLDFILSFILPRRMVKRINMKFYISLLLILSAAFLNISTSNIHAKKDAEKGLNLPSMYDQVEDGYTIPNFPYINTEDVKDYEVPNTGSEDKDPLKVEGTCLKSDENGVYHDLYEANGAKIDFTVVIRTDLYAKGGTAKDPVVLDNFDLEGYTKQVKEKDTNYVLYVLTMDSFFYLYNLEKDEEGNDAKTNLSVYMYELDTNSKKTKFMYYLPASEEELKLNEYGDFDTTLWTRSCSEDDQIDFDITDETFKTMEVKPATRHLKNLSNALYGGMYSYANLTTNGVNMTEMQTNFGGFLKSIKAAFIEVDTATLKTMTLIFSLIITIIFPFLLSLIGWALTKSFNIKKYRQFFAIAAICFFDVSLIAIILGIFLGYGEMAFGLLIAASIYYIVSTFRINTMKNDDEDNPGNETKEKEEKSKTVVYNKPESDSAQIG